MGQAQYLDGINAAFYKPVTNTVFKDTWETRAMSKEMEVGTEDLIQFLIALQDRVASCGVYLGLGQVRVIVDKIREQDHADYYHMYRAFVTVEEDDRISSPTESPRNKNKEGYLTPKPLKNTSGKLTRAECQTKSNELLKLIGKVDFSDPETGAPPSPREPKVISLYSASDTTGRPGSSPKPGRSPRSSSTLPHDGGHHGHARAISPSPSSGNLARVSPSSSSGHLSAAPSGTIRTSPSTSPSPNRAGGSPRPTGSMIPRINSTGFSTLERQPYVRQSSNPREPTSPGLDVSPLTSPTSPRLTRPSSRAALHHTFSSSPGSPKPVPTLSVHDPNANVPPQINSHQQHDQFQVSPMTPLQYSMPESRQHNVVMASPRVQEPNAVYRREELKQLTQQMYNIVNQVYMDSQLFCKDIPSSQYSVISSQCLINLSKVSKAAALIQRIDSKGACQDIQNLLPVEIGNVMDIYRGIASSGDKTIVFSSNLFNSIAFLGKLLGSLNWDCAAVFTKIPM